MTLSHVRRVIVEDLRAVGIEVRRFGDIQTIMARKEVILSAGAVGSPQIMMLSGVVDSEELQSVGVNPVHHLPNVGKNLQDHLISSISVDVNPGQSLNILSAFNTFSELIQNGTGPFTAPGGCTGLAHVRADDSKSHRRPAIQGERGMGVHPASCWQGQCCHHCNPQQA
jgi:choline dehydrogenase-like flavoprotein